MHRKRKGRFLQGTFLRLIILGALFSVLCGVLVNRLFDLQIVNGESYKSDFTMRIKKERKLSSTRGEIYDCDGNLLAYNKLSYVVTFEDSGYYPSTHIRNLTLNSTLYRSIQIIEGHGDNVYTDFHVFLDEDGQYAYDATGFTLSRFKADVFGQIYIDDLTEEQRNISAADLIELLCSTKYYGILDERITVRERADYELPDSFTKEEILQLCAMRNLLAQNSYQRYNSITIAKDVCEETVAQLLENSDVLAGIDVSEDYQRVYNDAEYFAQIIGYTGKVSSEELASLQEANPDKRYDSSDIVGKVGLEQVMEAQLHGDKGLETLYVDNLGRELSVESRDDPQAGNNLYLTISSDLQKAAYKILEQYIAGILWSHIVDTDEINEEWYTSSDDVVVPVYDVYFSLFENNVLDVAQLSDADASVNEKHVYELFLKKSDEIFREIHEQLTTAQPTAYKDLTEEMQVYQSYIVNTMLPAQGILNRDAIDESDLTWIAWNQDETISLQEFLTYAISKNWIDMNGVIEESSYMDSYEIYTALSEFISKNLIADTDFCKRVFRYMLKEGSLSGSEVCLLLYDQNILERNDADYDALSSGEMSAYDFIRDKIYNLELTPAQLALMPCSGSIVIVDPGSGDVKCCVSYPGYDNNRLVNEMDSAYYTKLVTDLSSPFYSRATQEVLAPGSTFKIVTATAGIMENQVSVDEGIVCTGKFTEVDPEIKCWVYPGAHGAETLQGAIRDSCNYYFNTIGYRLSMVSGTYQDDTGVATLQKYASMYGFDAKSGVEVPESAPHMATYGAVPMAMGQSNNAFTVSQLARYVATIANKGTCYDLTLIDKVTDTNGNTIDENDPTIHSLVELPDYLWSTIHGGMRDMVRNHSVLKAFNDVAIAGKTGTAQEVVTKPTHSEFIGFAPYSTEEAPTMAIAARIANGYSSANAAALAMDTVSYYFGSRPEAELLTGHAVEAVTVNDAIQD